jgi:hypothetical protein
VVFLACRVLTELIRGTIVYDMTQIGIILQGFGLIALYWVLPMVIAGAAYAAYKRSKVRYHVGNPRVAVPVQTFRTKAAARKASMALYREYHRHFRISSTR